MDGLIRHTITLPMLEATLVCDTGTGPRALTTLTIVETAGDGPKTMEIEGEMERADLAKALAHLARSLAADLSH